MPRKKKVRTDENRAKERAWHAAHRDQRNADTRERARNRTPEHKAARKQALREWHLNNKAHVKAYRERTKDRRNTQRRQQYAENETYREQMKCKSRTFWHANPAKKKAQRLQQYGITLEEFSQMFQAQNMACAICGYADLADKKIFPIVDHCHTTGRIRGLLCMHCNQGLGKFKDDPVLLTKAIQYLLQNNGLSGLDSM